MINNDEKISEINKGQELSPELASEVRSWSRELLDEYWDSKPNEQLDSSDSQRNFLRSLAVVVGAEDDFRKGFIRFPLAPAVTVFIEELFAYCREKSAAPDTENNYQRFLWTIQKRLLSVSPSIFNYQLFLDQIKTAATATRVPEFNRVVGQNFEGELLYQFAFLDSESAKGFGEKASRWQTGEILDTFHLLQSLATEAAVNEDWSEGAVKNSTIFVKTVCEIRQQPILSLAAQNFSQYITDAYATGDPSLIPGGGRSPEMMEITEMLAQAKLEQSISPIDAAEGTMIPIAKDAIAVFDSSGLPRNIASFSFSEAKPLLPFLPRSLEAIKGEVERHPQSPQALLDFVSRLGGTLGVSLTRLESSNVSLDPMQSDVDINWDGSGLNIIASKDLDSEKVGEALYDVSAILDPEEWGSLLQNSAKVADLINEAYGLLDAGDDPNEVNDELFANPVMIEVETILAKLDSRWEDLREDITDSIDDLLEKAKEKLPQVRFKPFEMIATDPDMIPFGSDDPKTLTILLEQMQRPSLRRSIEENLKIRLIDIPLRSQIHLLRFLSSRKENDFGRLTMALKRSGVNKVQILESFLANAEDEKYGVAIIDLAEKMAPEVLEVVLGKYHEITQAVEGIDAYLAHAFSGLSALKQHERTQIIRQLLHRGNEFLLSLSSTQKKPEEIVRELERIKADILLFAAAFKVMTKSENVSLEDIRGVDLATLDSSEITPEERAEMVQVYRDNRQSYSPQLLAKTTSDFEQAVDTAGKKFYLLKKDGVIAAFVRFDDLGDKGLYCASFNVRPEARGSAVGTALLRQVIEQEGWSRDISLVVYGKNPIVPTYEKFGFKKTEEIPNYEGAGELFYKMTRLAPVKKATLQPGLAA